MAEQRGIAWVKYTTFTYDGVGRVQTTSYAHLLGTDTYTYTYNDRDQVLTSTRNTHEGKTIIYDYTYDHGGRLIEVNIDIDGVSEEVSIMEYNERDWLVNDRLGVDDNDVELYQIGYAYNSRGWLRRINDIGDCQLDETAPEPTTPKKETKLFSEDAIFDVFYNEVALANGDPSSIGIVCTFITSDGDEVTSIIDSVTIMRGHYGFPQNYSTNRTYQTKGKFNPATVTDIISEELFAHVCSENAQHLGLISLKYLKAELLDKLKDVDNSDRCKGDQLFSEVINYITTDNVPGAQSQFNGNVSSVKWRAVGREYASMYGFQYDDLDRLINANYIEKKLTPGGASQNSGRYSSNYAYDNMGNITSLSRSGLVDVDDNGIETFGIIDQLTLNYNNTRIEDVSEAMSVDRGFKSAGGAYTYDGRGNVTAAPNVTSIGYNALNLPSAVSLENGGSLANVYDPSGAKIRKVVSPPTDDPENMEEAYILDYVDGIEYRNQVIESIPHKNGRIIFEDDVPLHEYVIKDHLGSARVYFSDKDGDRSISIEAGEVTQELHYYPFGLAIESMDFIAPVTPINQKGYTGMEEQRDGNFDWVDYGARFYNPAIGRFMQVDPLAIATPRFNTYVYALNSPMRYNDPTGLLASESEFSGVTVYGVAGWGGSSISLSSSGKRTRESPVITYNDPKSIDGPHIKLAGSAHFGIQAKTGFKFLGVGEKIDVGWSLTLGSVELLIGYDQTVLNFKVINDLDSEITVGGHIVSIGGSITVSASWDGQGNINFSPETATVDFGPLGVDLSTGEKSLSIFELAGSSPYGFAVQFSASIQNVEFESVFLNGDFAEGYELSYRQNMDWINAQKARLLRDYLERKKNIKFKN